MRGCEGGLGLYSACISLLHPLQEDTHSMNTLDCGWAWSSCGVEQTGLSARGCAHAAPLPSQREAALPSPESWSSVASQGLNHHFKQCWCTSRGREDRIIHIGESGVSLWVLQEPEVCREVKNLDQG